MAGQEDSAAAATTAPRAEGSGQEQEKPQAQDEAGRQQTEAATSGGEGTTGSQQQQQTEKEPPSPPLPPRPLPPPPHQGSRNSRPPLPMPMPQQGVHFGPLPIEVDDDKPDAPYERRSSPRWQKASLIIGGMSLVTSAIILGVGIGLGYLSAPYYRYWDLFTLADLQFVLSASAAGLAILITALDFLTACLSSRRLGMHPGALVAFHLIIWLLALVAVIFTALFMGYNTYDEYDYSFGNDGSWVESKSYVYQQVLLAFDAILLGLHFILFIGACVETSKVNHAKKKVVIVRVPVQAGPYPGAQYPVYGSPQTYFPPGQQPVPAPLPNQPAAVYGGYYAPTAQDLGMGWQVNSPQWQGYYATAAIPANAPRQSWQQQPPAPALASSSGSRRSQRLSQAQAQPQPQPQAQASPAAAAPERTA